MTRRLAPTTALALALRASVAVAEAPTSARLSWVRGENATRCPDAGFVASRVIAHLRGVDPFTTPASISVEAFVDHDDEGWHARIFDRDATGALLGARSFDSDEADCDGVAQATALSIALTLNHGTLAPTPPPEAPAPPERPPVVPTPPVEATPAAPAEPPLLRPRAITPRTRLELSASARVAVAQGFAPGLSALFALHAEGTVRGRVRWMAEAFTSTSGSPDDAASYAFRFVGGRLGACVEAWQGRVVSFEGCAAFTGGGLAITVTDAVVDDASTGLWLGASLDAVARVTPLRPLLLEAGVSASVPFTRPRYEDAANRAPGPSLVYESPIVAAMAWFGVGVSIR